ncbi:MAG TPA: glutaredoxin domain-containing protein [Dehalococcoidia bacterium]|nr:glutaredoxin domain-containing protein [Dehalococcoidia bacterium]
MSRLVVYLRSSFCPDVSRWRRWVADHPVEYTEFDIDHDAEAYDKVLAWTGHESVPTLVIAPDDGVDPIEEPAPLPGGRGPRAVDRGTMLTEPNPGQIAPFLERHGIAFENADGDAVGSAESRPWRRRG